MLNMLVKGPSRGLQGGEMFFGMEKKRRGREEGGVEKEEREERIFL